jgi:hypothetical protein
MEGISRVRATVAENCRTLWESMPGVCDWVPAKPIDPLPSIGLAGHADSRHSRASRWRGSSPHWLPDTLLRIALLRCTV